MRLSSLPDDILSGDQRDKLENIGLTTCEAVMTAPDGDLAGVRDKDKLRAAASLGALDVDAMLFPRLLGECQAGTISLVKADAAELADRLNADVPKDEQIKPDAVVALQEDAAVMMLRAALAQLLAQGWATQLAGFESPDDDLVKALEDLLRTCGGFAQARPLVERINEVFSGFGGAFGAGADIRKTIADIEQQPDEFVTRQAEVRRKVAVDQKGWPPGAGVETIIGLGDDAAAKLTGAGLGTVARLRYADASSVAAGTGLDPSSVETWRRQADLQARPGISPSTAYALVTFDAGQKQTDRVYRHVLGLSGLPPTLPDSVEHALYKHGDKLLADGAVRQDPFPYRAGLDLDQQSLMALTNLHSEVNVRNVLLDLDSDDAREVADGLVDQWFADTAVGGGLLTPVSPTFFSKVRPPYPAGDDVVVDEAERTQASAVLRVVVQGDADQIAFPASLTLTVVPRSMIEADPALARMHITQTNPPNYWMRIDALDQLWSDVTANFKLRELLGDGNFDARFQPIVQATRLEDARRETYWDDFAATFPIYAPVALVHTAEMIQALREEVNLPFTLGSGYRTVTNPASSGRSRHMWGTAIDLDYVGGQPVDFTPRPEYDNFSRVAWLAHMVLPDQYATWDAEQQLDPLPSPDPADLDHASYVEDHLAVGTASHLHFDWGYPTQEQEEQLIASHAPRSAGPGGKAIRISTAPYEPDDWMAGDASVALAEAIQHHVAAAFKPGAPVTASVPDAAVAANARLAKLVKKGVPAIEVVISPAMVDVLHQSPGQMAGLAQAVIGGLLAPDGRQLSVIHGRVLGQAAPKGPTQPLAKAKVSLALGATTDISVDSAFGGILGVEYQTYNETLTDADGHYDLFLVSPARGSSTDPTPVRIAVERAGYGPKRADYRPTSKTDQQVPDIVLSQLALSGAGGCGRTIASTAAATILASVVAARLLRRRRT